jgi:signal transduction histidine kinase
MRGGVGLGLVIASVAAGCGAVFLLRYLYLQRGKAGATWFMGNIAAVIVFCVSYGMSLLVFDPSLRVAFESISFSSFCFMGPFFLAFGLGYTGRSDLIHSSLFGIVAVVPLLTVVLTATNAVHGLVWTGFEFAPVFGLATVDYAIQPWGVFALLFCVGTAAIGSLLLVGAIISYGSLYRREATAVILSTVPPTVGVLLWLFELGPVPQLHLTAPLMLIHVSLDLYAFVGTHMFETNPATQRVAEQTGLNTLTEPVVILDPQGQAVKLNESARHVFAHVSPDDVPVPLETLTGVDVATLRETGEVAIRGSEGGSFAVSFTPLTDPSESSVGEMLVLYDLTEERRRKQQLTVLNRVFRHNLRNEMSVVQGFASSLEHSVSDPTLQNQAKTIRQAGDRLLAIGEQVREFDRIQDQVMHAEPVDLAETVTRIRSESLLEYPDATIEIDCHVSDPTVHVQPQVLDLALSNLSENALKHAASAHRDVQITIASTEDAGMCVEIRDDNEPIADAEIAVLRDGDETPLEHGQGIGLWIVNWSLTVMNGELAYRYENGNVFELTLPTQ